MIGFGLDGQIGAEMAHRDLARGAGGRDGSLKMALHRGPLARAPRKVEAAIRAPEFTQTSLAC